MEDKEPNPVINKESEKPLTWLGFEINPSQMLIIKIFSVIGVFLMPFTFAQDIFYAIHIPLYLINLQLYGVHFLSDNLPYIFLRVIIDGLYLFLVLYSFQKLFQDRIIEKKYKILVEKHQKIVKWMGFHLNQSQAIFIFVISLIGVIELPIQCVLALRENYHHWYWNLFDIPKSFNFSTGHSFFDTYFSFMVILIFLIMSIYSFGTIIRKKYKGGGEKSVKNIFLLLFVVSVMIFVITLFRLFMHLFLLSPLARLIGIFPRLPNPYQLADLIVIIITLSIISYLIRLSFYKRGPATEKVAPETSSSTNNEKLQPKNVLIVLLLAILGELFFAFTLLEDFAMFSVLSTSWIFSSVGYLNLPILIIFLLLFYVIYKIVKQEKLNRILVSINEKRVECVWFHKKLGNEECVILFAIGIAFVVRYLYLSTTWFQSLIFRFLLLPEEFNLYGIVLDCFFAGLSLVLLLICIYTVIKAYKPYRSL